MFQFFVQEMSSCEHVYDVSDRAMLWQALDYCVGVSHIEHLCVLRKLFEYLLHSELTPWLIEPGGSMPHSQGLSNDSNHEPNQPN